MNAEYFDKKLNKLVKVNPGDHIIYYKNGLVPLKSVFIECSEYSNIYTLDIKEDIEKNMPKVRWTFIFSKNDYIELDTQYYRDIKLNQLLK